MNVARENVHLAKKYILQYAKKRRKKTKPKSTFLLNTLYKGKGGRWSACRHKTTFNQLKIESAYLINDNFQTFTSMIHTTKSRDQRIC